MPFAVIGDEVHYGEIVQVRWQCPRGHFVADASIHCEDYRDDSAYYGIRTECRYTCRGCGETYQELPRSVAIDGAVK